MVVLLVFIGCMALFFVAYNLNFSFDIQEPFACGSDEVCYCEESKDCKRKNEEEKD